MSSATLSQNSHSAGGLKGKALGILAIVILGLWMLGVAYVFAGVLAGTMLVIGMMLTIEQVKGFWTFATWGPGKAVTLIGTAWLAHVMFGSSSLIGMIALAWSLILKAIILNQKQLEMRTEHRRAFARS